MTVLEYNKLNLGTLILSNETRKKKEKNRLGENIKKGSESP